MTQHATPTGSGSNVAGLLACCREHAPNAALKYSYTTNVEMGQYRQ
jgi:hypothetical protein